VVVVTEQVQEAVEREHAQFGELGVVRAERLAASHAAGDHDLS
jgi:hypothetical protein